MKILSQSNYQLEIHMKLWMLLFHFHVSHMKFLTFQKNGTQVAFAESNAAIHANSYDNLKTNKESAFSALASAITGKSPYSLLRKEDTPNVTIRMKVKDPTELTYGMLGFFAGKVGDTSVNISGLGAMDKRQCKAMCGGMGTSGTCAKFLFGDSNSDCEKVDFDKKEMQTVHDELNTAEKGDLLFVTTSKDSFQ